MSPPFCLVICVRYVVGNGSSGALPCRLRWGRTLVSPFSSFFAAAVDRCAIRGTCACGGGVRARFLTDYFDYFELEN